jgi:hypothetical protein
VSVPPARPSILRRRVFRGSAVVAAGVLTRDQLRSAAWRRLRRDVYADADLPVDHRLATWGVSLAAPSAAVFGGLTAVVLAGGHAFAGPDDPVEVVLPPGERWQPGPGVLLRSAPLSVDVVVGRQGLRRTAPVRTAVDLIRRGEVDDGVVMLDRLAAAGLVGLARVRMRWQRCHDAGGVDWRGRSWSWQTDAPSPRRRPACDC